MGDSSHPMAAILAAAEAGQGEFPSEAELRARLDALLERTWKNGWSQQERGEHRLLCRALDRAAAERGR